jgi:hypothetical protein
LERQSQDLLRGELRCRRGSALAGIEIDDLEGDTQRPPGCGEALVS